MRTDRRGFLGLLALVTGSGLLGFHRTAQAGETAVGIHRATRNTLLGAIGTGLRSIREPLRPFKIYPGRHRIGLGERPAAAGAALHDAVFANPAAAAVTAATPAAAPRTLARDVLGRMLHFTNGDTGRGDGNPYRLRAAPSAGALYAGEIYVIAMAVGGLDRGVYYYDVGAHNLVRLRETVDAGELAEGFERGESVLGAAALVCISNVFERYERRYANRGYRYALIDTGHIGENLRLEAAGLGLAHAVLERFHDDRVNALLGVDGRDEAACAVHAVGGVAATATGGAPAAGTGDAPAAGAAGPSVSHLVEKLEAGVEIPTDPVPTLRYHEATKLVAAPARPAARQRRRGHSGPGSDSAAPSARGERVPLPMLAEAPADRLERCIADRRSPHAFARRSIEAGQLGYVARAALPGTEGGRDVELLLAVHRVAGIDPGLYRLLSGSRELAVIRKEDLTDALPRACLGQSKAGDASVGFLMVGRLQEAASARGERSYRDLLIEAGEIGQRIYLAAEAVGLCARNLAAFLDDDINDIVGLDGRTRAVVHLTLLGHAA